MSDNKLSTFQFLKNIDISKFTDDKEVKFKTGKKIFSYLTWTHAISILQEHYPGATWEVKRFDGVPYMKAPSGYLVEVGVTINGMERTQIHPVLDHSNQSVQMPTSSQINTSIQRCLVKAIALHGLGLSLYSKEDLPDTSNQESREQELKNKKSELKSLVAKTKTDEGEILAYLKKKGILTSSIYDVEVNVLDMLIKLLKKKEAK